MTRSHAPHDDPDTHQNTYPIELEDASEAARLTILSRVVTRQLDDLLPPEVEPLASIQVLDVGCGPGGWVHEVAYSFPKAEVVGIDVSQTMLDLASSGARAQGLNNAFFERIDAAHTLPFSDGTFDVVQARFCNSFLLQSTWPQVVSEWVRVTRPGGVVRILDGDGLGESADPAFEQLELLLRAAWQRDPRGRVWPIGPHLGLWLRQAGMIEVREQSHVLDFSAPVLDEDPHAYEAQYERNASMSEVVAATCTLLAPFLLRQTGMFPETLHALSQQVALSMRQPLFRGQLTLLEVVGRVSASEQESVSTQARDRHHLPPPGNTDRSLQGKEEREAQDARQPPMSGDTRPSFRQLLERYHLTCAQVAERARIDIGSAHALFTGQPVLVEHIDALLTALSMLTGQAWDRLTVGHLHIRTNYW